MPKREYKGNAIDATMQYVSEALDSGSVEVPSDGDEGSEKTDSIPSFVDRDEYTDLELKRVRFAILNPDSTLKDLCKQHDFNYQETSSFLANFRRKYEDELKNAGLWNAVTFGPQRSVESSAKETKDEEIAKVQDYFRENPNGTVGDAIDELEVSQLSRQEIAGQKGHVIQHITKEETADQDTVEKLRADVDELQEQIAILRQSVEDINSELTDRAEQRDSRITDEISEDALFAIISGDELTDEQRREVFEVFV